MKEATWIVVVVTLGFIGVRLGVIILPSEANGLVNLAPAQSEELASDSAQDLGEESIAPSTDTKDPDAVDPQMEDAKEW